MHFYLALKMDLSMSLIGWCEVWRCWSSMVSCTYDWNGMLHRFGSYVGSKIVLENSDHEFKLKVNYQRRIDPSNKAVK